MFSFVMDAWTSNKKNEQLKRKKSIGGVTVSPFPAGGFQRPGRSLSENYHNKIRDKKLCQNNNNAPLEASAGHAGDSPPVGQSPFSC